MKRNKVLVPQRYFLSNQLKVIKVVAIAALFMSVGWAQSAAAYSSHVKILDLDRNVICDNDFTGTTGMDSIINTAATCNFTYSLGFGNDFLDNINGIGWDGTNWWALYINGALSNVGVNDASINLDAVSEIMWVFSDGNYVPSVNNAPIINNGGGVIVGLMSASTGGLIDSDGDEISDKKERENGTNPHIREASYVKKQAQIAAAVRAKEDAAKLVHILTDILSQLKGLVWSVNN